MSPHAAQATPPTARCPATGKVRYTGREALLLVHQNRRKDRRPWASFHCSSCGDFHLTSHARDGDGVADRRPDVEGNDER